MSGNQYKFNILNKGLLFKILIIFPFSFFYTYYSGN